MNDENHPPKGSQILPDEMDLTSADDDVIRRRFSMTKLCREQVKCPAPIYPGQVLFLGFLPSCLAPSPLPSSRYRRRHGPSVCRLKLRDICDSI